MFQETLLKFIRNKNLSLVKIKIIPSKTKHAHKSDTTKNNHGEAKRKIEKTLSFLTRSQWMWRVAISKLNFIPFPSFAIFFYLYCHSMGGMNVHREREKN